MKILVILSLGFLAWDNLSWLLDELGESPPEEWPSQSYQDFQESREAKCHAFLVTAVSVTGLFAAIVTL